MVARMELRGGPDTEHPHLKPPCVREPCLWGAR
jgi:hypothetical protein